MNELIIKSSFLFAYKLPSTNKRFHMDKTTHIAVVSIPAFSHQASIVELCKRLVHLEPRLHVTCIFPTIVSPPDATIAFLRALPSAIDYVFLPPQKLQDLPAGTLAGVQIQVAVSRSMPSVREKLKSLSSTSRLVCLIADSFANEALAIGKELNVLSYIYEPSTVMMVSLSFHLPEMEESASSAVEYRDLSEVIHLPGCVPFHSKDIPNHLHVRSTEAYLLFLQRCKRHRLADGVLVNSCPGMEAEAITALTEGRGRNQPPVHPVGPIVQTWSSYQTDGSDCLRWLENQPRSSVLYVSFGTGGTLSKGQLDELALGLEMSGQKFLWVLTVPNKSSSAAFINGTASKEDPLGFLPSGFLERTKEQGLVVPLWAPQIQVLSHGATGGFLSHCGWNSTLESVVHGVPMIAWPLFYDQKMNAVMLTNGLNVALRPQVNENGIVQKEEIAKVIKSLMRGDNEGRRICRRMKELQEAAANALRQYGSSTRTLSHLALKWRNFKAEC